MEGRPPRVIETPNEQTDAAANDEQPASDADVPPSESAVDRRRPKPGPIGRPAEEH